MNVIKYLRKIYFFYLNYLFFKINRVYFYKNNNILGKVHIKNKGNLIIGEKFTCSSGVYFTAIGGDSICRLKVLNNATLKIGDNVGISNSTIYCSNRITIGNNVLIGGGCKIWDTDFHALNPYIRIIENDRVINSKPIVIEDNVFIGGSSIILKGVRIGKNSIIGAGSVVSKSISRNEIWAGNPAQFIKKVDISNEF